VWRIAGIRLIMAGVLLAAAPVACSDDGPDEGREPSSTPRPSASTTTGPGESPTPRATPGEALDALLRAEQQGDRATSFRLLDRSGREQYRDVAEWTRRRVQLPALTGFTLERAEGTRVVAEVRHRPGLDPFTGLSAARERQTWTASEAGDGFLLRAEPEVEYLLPPEAEATESVLAWARAVQACNQNVAESKQAVRPLFGGSIGAGRLCGSTTALATGEVAKLDGGLRSADLVAQYSTDALAWARVVPLRGPEPEVKVVVAPIGESWQVVAVYD
jgi:hypothetical protein